MKKIRLTENDLNNLVKKIIKEYESPWVDDEDDEYWGDDDWSWMKQFGSKSYKPEPKMSQEELEELRYENVQHGDILVIHPDDRTTDFLKPSYADLDATVITQANQVYNLKETIKNHNRIIMMGHGSPGGLFMPRIEGVQMNESTGQLEEYSEYSIGRGFADVLRDKRIAAIWCHADGYVVPNDLHGFYTGMAISELCEADWCGVRGCSEEQLNESSTLFALALKEALKVDSPESVKIFKDMYYNPDNPIMVYNRQRIYFR